MADAQMRAIAAVRNEIRSSDTASKSKYLREFNQSFRSYDAVLNDRQVDQQITAADIVLVGDYHSLPQSQKFTTTLIEQISKQRPVVLGAEAMFSRDQHTLDSWWRRDIGEPELRSQLRFDREWGYQWDPFYQLLIAARNHCEGIYGLDCTPREDLRRIRARDRHAVARICEMRRLHPDAVIVVLFGESHMAPDHLPAMLRKALPDKRSLTILQNVDTLYWQAIAEKAPAVSIDENTVCVFNSTPLEKYESFRLCLERWNAAADEPPDFAPSVYNVIFSLARCLGFQLDSPQNGSQPKSLADSIPEVITVGQDADDLFGPTQLAAELAGPGPARHRIEQLRSNFLKRLEDRGCVYIPAANRFLVRELRLSEIAAEAARFLHHTCAGSRIRERADTRIEDALSYLGSRLLCQGMVEMARNDFGETLYQAYICRQISRADLRQIFLGHVEGASIFVPTQSC